VITPSTHRSQVLTARDEEASSTSSTDDTELHNVMDSEMSKNLLNKKHVFSYLANDIPLIISDNSRQRNTYAEIVYQMDSIVQNLINLPAKTNQEDIPHTATAEPTPKLKEPEDEDASLLKGLHMSSVDITIFRVGHFLVIPLLVDERAHRDRFETT
jgi:hypothetical protein